MDVDALLDRLDAEQRAAVVEPGGPLAIVAAAGSGKTTVLTRRIAHRIATEPGVLARHVLALTFTNQAAGELQRRLHRVGVRESIVAGTFHRVALQLLRRRAADTGRPTVKVAGDATKHLVDAARFVDAKLDAQLVRAELDWARARCIGFEQYNVAARRAGRDRRIDGATLAKVADEYTRRKRRAGILDFDDALETCLDALRRDTGWASGVRWWYRHLFVDEAQDINPLQFQLLEAIRGDRPDVCLVGDPRQAIFGFNGADPEIMNRIEDLYPGVRIVHLRRNYRCTPEVIATGAKVLERSGQADDSVAVSPPGPSVQLRAFADGADEAAGIAHAIRAAVGPHQHWRSCAVLARTSHQLNGIARALDGLGIPHGVRRSTSWNVRLDRTLTHVYGMRTHQLAEWVQQTGESEAGDEVARIVAVAADRYLAEAPDMSFSGWVELHAPFDDLSDDPLDVVDLLTFHAAKGREWQRVFVTGVEVGLVPHSGATTTAQRAEEARLLYVACTRAREELTLTWAERRGSRRSGRSPLVPDVDDVDGDAEAPHQPWAASHPRLPPPDPVLEALIAWRRTAARVAQVDPLTICSDQALAAVARERPRTPEAVAGMLGLGPIAAARLAPRLLAALQKAIRETGIRLIPSE